MNSTDVSFLDNFFAPQAQDVLDFEKAFLSTKIIHHQQQEADLRLLSYNILPEYDSLNISNNKALVELHVSGTRVYGYDKSPHIISNETHVFEVSLTSQGWRITYHISNETLEQDFRNYYKKNGLDINKTKKEVLSQITTDTIVRRNDLNNGITNNNMETTVINSANVSILAYANSYNRSAFVNYGMQWHNGTNPNYNVLGNDCANFGSQCLKAGGAPDDKVAPSGSTHPDDYKWYYDGQQRYSWYAAQGLRYYLRNNNGSSSNIGVKAAKVSTISSVYEGDFAFNIDPSNDRATHTIPIVGSYYSSNGVKVDLWIVQHSCSPSYGLLSQVTLTGRTRELIHISGVYK